MHNNNVYYSYKIIELTSDVHRGGAVVILPLRVKLSNKGIESLEQNQILKPQYL